MAWIVFGFGFALFLELIFGVLSNYKFEEKKEVSRTQISLPWYGWGLAGLATWGILRKNKRRK